MKTGLCVCDLCPVRRAAVRRVSAWPSVEWLVECAGLGSWERGEEGFLRKQTCKHLRSEPSTLQLGLWHCEGPQEGLVDGSPKLNIAIWNPDENECIKFAARCPRSLAWKL